MIRPGLIRFGGLAAMLSGVALVVLWLWVEGDWLAGPLASPAIHLLMVGAMAAIVALHALQSQHYGLAGTVASLAAFVGFAMYLVGAGVAYARDDFFVAFPATAFLVAVGLLAATAGLLVLGLVTLKAGVLPWWCGAALIAGNPLIEYFLAFWFGGLLGVPWAVVGYAILRAAGRRTEQASRVR
jgi:hypothetical protein